MAKQASRMFVKVFMTDDGVVWASDSDGEVTARLASIVSRPELVRLAFRVLGSNTWATVSSNDIRQHLLDHLLGQSPIPTKPRDVVVDKHGDDEVVSTETNAESDVLKQVRDLLGGSVDYAKVNDMIKAEVAKVISVPNQIVINDVPLAMISGLVHAHFATVCTWVSANVPVFLVGGAGTGKTTIAVQIAEALGLPRTVVIQADALPQRAEIFGYKSPITGDYIDGGLYDVYKNGGLYVIDEFDTGHASLGTNLNLLTANGFYDFPNGERVIAHEQFRIIVTGNTYGQGGSVEFAGTNRINGATLDRFVKEEIYVDEKLERQLVTNICSVTGPRVHDIVTRMRANGYKHGLRVFVTPRASVHVTKGVVAGLTVRQAITAKILTGLPSDQQDKLLEGVSL